MSFKKTRIKKLETSRKPGASDLSGMHFFLTHLNKEYNSSLKFF